MNNQAYDQPNAIPTPKVAAGAIGGSLSVLLIFLVKAIFDMEVPAEVGASLATIIGFLSAYFTRDKKPVDAIPLITKETK